MSGSMPPSRWLPPHEKNKIEQGGPSSPLEPSEGAFELTYGSACISPRGHCGGGPFNEVLTGVKRSTTGGSALGGAVFEVVQILAHLVNRMSTSQYYLGCGHFA